MALEVVEIIPCFSRKVLPAASAVDHQENVSSVPGHRSSVQSCTVERACLQPLKDIRLLQVSHAHGPEGISTRYLEL